MAIEVINVGTVPNDGTGDGLRTAYIKCNNNFAFLNSFATANPPTTLYGSVGDTAGTWAYDSTFFYYCFQDYTDGTNIIWGKIGSGAGFAAGSNTQVQFNNNGVFQGNSGFTFNSDIGELAVTGNIVVGNVSTNTLISGSVTATGNITGGNLVTSGSATITGNANVGNIGVSGLITTTGNITATGNISGGNILVSGNIVDTGALRLVTGASGAIALSPNGSNVLVATTTGANITGTFNATGNATVGNISATNANITSITATGNANVGNLGTTGLVTTTGNVSANVFLASTYIRITPVPVANLPAASTAGSGARAFVTDSSSTTFAANVTTGGSNVVPVYSTGTVWKIG